MLIMWEIDAMRDEYANRSLKFVSFCIFKQRLSSKNKRTSWFVNIAYDSFYTHQVVTRMRTCGYSFEGFAYVRRMCECLTSIARRTKR